MKTFRFEFNMKGRISAIELQGDNSVSGYFLLTKNHIQTKPPYTNTYEELGFRLWQMAFKMGWKLDIYYEFLTRVVCDGKELWKKGDGIIG